MENSFDLTKQHFSEICEYIWSQVFNSQSLNKKAAKKMRQDVADFARIVWEYSLTASSKEETLETIRKFAENAYKGDRFAIEAMEMAAELKWDKYPDDKHNILSAEVIYRKSKPRLDIVLHGENPALDVFLDDVSKNLTAQDIEDLFSSDKNSPGKEKIRNIIAAHVDSLENAEDTFASPVHKIQGGKMYVFRVLLERAPEIYRDIAILGSQTFHDLHEAIFDAFDRFDEHLYCFYFKGKRIVGPDCDVEEGDLEACETEIGSRNMKKGDTFSYLFDFGDCWEHRIELLHVDNVNEEFDYPMVLNFHGKSPEQYEYEDEYFDDMITEVMHPMVLDFWKKNEALPPADEDTLSIECCLSLPTPDDKDDFVRGNISITTPALADIVTMPVVSLKKLFRKSDCSSNDYCGILHFMVAESVAMLADSGVISNQGNEDFIRIFTAMSADPDAPSDSVLHSAIWNVCACFLLAYECKLTVFKKLMKDFACEVRALKKISFVQICIDEVDVSDDFADDIEFDDDDEFPF